MDEMDVAPHEETRAEGFPKQPPLSPSSVALIFALLGLASFAVAHALGAPETILKFSKGVDLKELELDGTKLLGVLLFVAWVPLCVVFSAGLGVWALAGRGEEPLSMGDRISLLFVLAAVTVLGIHFGTKSKEWYEAYRARVAAAGPSETQ